MKSKVNYLLEEIGKNQVEFVNLIYTDLRGVVRYLTCAVEFINEETLQKGILFNTSNLRCAQTSLQDIDVCFIPDLDNYFFNSFTSHNTINIFCSLKNTVTDKFDRDSRMVAINAQKFIQQKEIADTCYIGSEMDFYIFDQINIKQTDTSQIIDISYPNLRSGEHPGQINVFDELSEIRCEISKKLKEININNTMHLQKNSKGQSELIMKNDSFLNSCDNIQKTKFVVKNVAFSYNKTATFMPKPKVDLPCSRMYINLSLCKNKKNIFGGIGKEPISDDALYFIGGLMKHARSLNAFFYSTTNSYKINDNENDLQMINYSTTNTGAMINIPYSNNNKDKKIELRFLDPLCNPYLAFSAALMAGMDGIINKIHPGNALENRPVTKEESYFLEANCTTLPEALEALRNDKEYLLKSNVFTEELINEYIELKNKEIREIRYHPNFAEYGLYFSN